MPHTLSCPSCGRKVLVREEWLDREVRCPACKDTFRAQVTTSASPAAADGSTQTSYEPEEYHEHERVRRRRRGPRARAREAVFGPAIGLMVSAGFGILCHLGWLVFGVVQVAGGVPMEEQHKNKDPGFRTGYVLGFVCASLAPGCIPLVCGAIVMLGAWRMMQLKSHWLAATSSILALLPCIGIGCLGGLPMGIWSLMVLNRDDVKRVFD